ncbi:MAG: right-handed parallel beta-helix repeat-containing protein [Kiritimatiellae bacterium]|nr:right-handed parallel beta-helix repeat-containing protein [Kiritimatiellia bacterium]
MKRIMGMILCVVGCVCLSGAKTLYVSPAGNDAWNGFERKKVPLREVAGPLATLEGARRRVRALRAEGAVASNEVVEVFFAAGEYPLLHPVTFFPEDSFVHYRAEKRARVTFSGGRKLYAFKEKVRPSAPADRGENTSPTARHGLWQTPIPEGLTFEQLYVDGERVPRAKSPNDLYFYMQEPVYYGKDPVTGKADTDLSRRAFIADPRDIEGIAGLAPDALSQVVIRVYHSWEVSQSRLQFADAKSGLVVGTASAPWPYFNWKPYLQRYVLENYREAMDIPGEWFADTVTGTLSYLPRPRDRIDSAQAVAPVTEAFLRIKGNALEERWVRDLRFEGFRFYYTAYTLPPNGQGCGQAAVSEGAAIEADGATGLSFRNCEIAHTGAHGIWLRKGCRDSEIVHCYLHDLGGGAVYIGDNRWSKEELPDKLTARITVDNNIFRDGGNLFPGAIGLWVGHASDLTLTHNDISDFTYTGVSMGWTWGYAETVTKRNTLAFNHIHHIGRGVLNDMGAVYTLGNQEGTVVTNNHIHDIWSYDYSGRGGWGLYTDEGSTGILFENNLVYRTKTGNIHQHYGKENVFRNNILANSQNGQIQRSRIEDHMTIMVTGNIIYWDNGSAAVWQGYPGAGRKVGDMFFDGNIWWNPHGMDDHAFQGMSWDQWRDADQDIHSLRVDPKFKNPAMGDFRLSGSSPAIRAGFKPFDPERAGVYGERAWTTLAKMVLPKPFRFAPEPPRLTDRRRIDTGFEDVPVGKPFFFFTNHVEGKGDAIQVTDALAHTGKRCLAVQDAPGLAQCFNPHFTLGCSHTNGVVENRFAIRVEPGSVVFNDWRDYSQGGNNYLTGVALGFRAGKVFAVTRAANAEGQLVRKEIAVCDMPTDTWCEVTVRYTLGGDGGTWSVRVTQEGKTLGQAEKLLPPDAAFRKLEWVGFGNNATVKTAFYLDDFAFGPVEK